MNDCEAKGNAPFGAGSETLLPCGVALVPVRIHPAGLLFWSKPIAITPHFFVPGNWPLVVIVAVGRFGKLTADDEALAKNTYKKALPLHFAGLNADVTHGTVP